MCIYIANIASEGDRHRCDDEISAVEIFIVYDA
jgi:hypothetical protein